jgi:hypothetical protein
MAVVLVVCIVYCVFRIDLYCSPLGGLCVVQYLDGESLLNHPFSTPTPPPPPLQHPRRHIPPLAWAPPRRLMGATSNRQCRGWLRFLILIGHGAGPGLVGRGGLAAKWSIATIMPARVWGS